MNKQMKSYKGRGLGGSRVQELLLPWSWGVVPSGHMGAFTNTEPPQTPYFRDFYGGFIMQT